MLNDDFFLREAIRIAEDNVRLGKGGPFGAIVVKNGEKISEGTNLVTETNDPTAHAEVVAIRRACEKLGSFQLTECVLYTSCYPCPMCFGAIYWARLKKVVYANTKEDAAKIGFDDAFIYSELLISGENRTIPFVRLSIPEALDAFEAWEKSDVKILY